MLVADLSESDLARRLLGDGLILPIGPFTVCFHSDIPAIRQAVRQLYADFPIRTDAPFRDFYFCVKATPGLRRWLFPRLDVCCEGTQVFERIPRSAAVAFWEWGLNRCIWTTAHQYLMLHSCVLERDGRALVLVGDTGAGKSTLSAALAFHGWRLVSEEMGFIDLGEQAFRAVVRPITLKNDSIELIRRLAPDAVFGPVSRNTVKGHVAHVRPPRDSLQAEETLVPPGWFVFVNFQKGQPWSLRQVPRGPAFMRLAHNSFNYGLHGEVGFRTLGAMVQESECFDLTYSDLEDAVARLSAAFQPGCLSHV